MSGMVRRGALLAVVVAGCGGSDEPLPMACAAEPERFERALRDAPGPVRIDGTSLGACVRLSASDADLQSLGIRLTTVADRLQRRAAAGDLTAAGQLGYLIGATQRAAENTEGIQAELGRRLQRSAAPLATDDADVKILDAVTRGIRAGEAAEAGA